MDELEIMAALLEGRALEAEIGALPPIRRMAVVNLLEGEAALRGLQIHEVSKGATPAEWAHSIAAAIRRHDEPKVLS